MEINLYSPEWWWVVYNQDEWTETIYDSLNNSKEVKAATLNLPKLITRVHAMHQISEPPKLLVNKKEYKHVKDIIKKSFLPVSSLLGLGLIFVVPHFDSRNRKTFYTVRYDDDFKQIRYSEKDGELEYLSYVKYENLNKIKNGQLEQERVGMHYEHFMQNGAYFYRKYYQDKDLNIIYIDGQTGENPISYDRMLPFMVKLVVNADTYGQPVWCNAWRLINDANRTYFETFSEMEVNRTFIGIPENLVEDSMDDPIDCDKLNVLSTKNRVFMIVNGVNDGTTSWEKFGGNYNPDGYYRLLNAQLADISSQCGFSRKFLSYDNNAASVRTAKEVIFNNNDAFISQQLINQTMAEYFTNIIQAYYYMDNKKWLNEDKIEIKFADNVFNSHEDEINTAHMAYKAGAITKEAYLKKLFPADNIDDIISEDEKPIDNIPSVRTEGEQELKEPEAVQTQGDKLQEKRPTSERL